MLNPSHQNIANALQSIRFSIKSVPAFLLCLSSVAYASENSTSLNLNPQSNQALTLEGQWEDILNNYNLNNRSNAQQEFENAYETVPLEIRNSFDILTYTPKPVVNYNWDTSKELIDDFFDIVANQEPLPCLDQNMEIIECDSMDALWDIGRLSLSVEHLAKALELAGIGVDSASLQHQLYNDITQHGFDIALITPALSLLELSSFEKADQTLLDTKQIKELSMLSLQVLYPDAFAEVGLNSNSQTGLKTPYSLWSTKAINLLMALENIPDDLCPEVRAELVNEQIEKIKGFGKDAKFSELMTFRHPSLQNSNPLFSPNLDLSISLTRTDTGGWNFRTENGLAPTATKEIISYQAQLLDASVTYTSNYWSVPSVDTTELPFSTQFTDSILDLTQNNYNNSIQSTAKNQLRSLLSGRSPFSRFELLSSGAGITSALRTTCILRCKNSDFYKKQFPKKASKAIKSTGQAIGHNWLPNFSSAKKAVDIETSHFNLQKFVHTTPEQCVSSCNAEADWAEKTNTYFAKIRSLEASLNRVNQRLQQNKKFINEFDARSQELSDNHTREQSQRNNDLDRVRASRDEALNDDAEPYNQEAENLKREEERIEREKAAAEDRHRKEQERLANEKREREEEEKRLQQERDSLEKDIAAEKEQREREQREREQREEQERQRQDAAADAADRPRTRDITCIDPNFQMPFQKKCVFKDGKWTVVTDQAAVDVMIFNKYCARMRVTEGTQCTVQGGGLTIKGLSLREDYRNKLPKKNLCWEVKLTENTTCEVINGRAVIKSIIPDYNNRSGITNSVSRYCQQVRTAEGFECRSTDGAIVDLTKNSVGINFPVYNNTTPPGCEADQNVPSIHPFTQEQIKLNLNQKNIFDYDSLIFGQ